MRKLSRRAGILILALGAVLACPGDSSALDDPVLVPGKGPATIHYRTGELVIRLQADAARRVSSLTAGPRPAPTRLDRLGLASLDRLAADLGGVWFEPEFPSERHLGASSQVDAGADELAAFFIAHLPPGSDLDRALRAFRRSSEIAAADRIAIVPVQAVPNDSLWDRAYYLYQPSRHDMHALEAWQVTAGDTGIVVAILDTGVLLDHPDLRDQIWIHWPERGGVPGVDDDGNGYVDDDRGWDFVALDSESLAVPGEDWRDADNDPNDLVAHGTAVAGLVAARTFNGIGVASTAWRTRIMPLRVGWSASRSPSGEIDLAYVARALLYAARNGAHVVNCSFTSLPQPDLVAAADAATRAGVTLVIAAGNGQAERYLASREDAIAVAATDQNDQVAGFSNRGSFVDVCAAGITVATASIRRPGPDSIGFRQPTYTTTASGTSFAAPLVAGAVALLQADRRTRGLPLLLPSEAQLRLRETADDIAAENPGLTGYGTGRVNLYRALTDPQRSFVIRAHGRSVGPAVVLPTLTGAGRIAFVTSDGRLVISPATGSAPLREVRLSAPPRGGLAAADLGGGHGIGLFVTTTDDRVAGFDEGGFPLPGWPVIAARMRLGQTSMPALGDLDGDGILEIVLGGDDGSIWAWNADGSSFAGFPIRLDSFGRTIRIALSDLDGQPGVEIVATFNGASVYVYRGDATVLPGWPSLAVSGPLDPLVVGLGVRHEPTVVLVSSAQVVALGPDGRTRWTRTINTPQIASPIAGDLDGDGLDEILLSLTPYTLTTLDSAGVIRSQADLHVALSAESPVIGSLGPGGGPAVLEYVQSGELIAFDRSGERIGPFPKPGGAGAAPTIVDLNGDGRSEVVGGTGRDSSFYVYDAGPATWNAAAQSWPTPRGNFARTGSRLYAPPMTVADDVPPLAVRDLSTGEIGTHTVELRWSAPSDSGDTGRARRYDLRRAQQPIDEASFASAVPVTGLPEPGPPGMVEHVVAGGLDESVGWFFALRSIDRGGNASPISNVITARTSNASPGTIGDLAVVTAADTTLVVRWTATGDDGSIGRPQVYRIHAAESRLDEKTFGAAPIALDHGATADAGGPETATLGGLVRGRRYWIAVQAVDGAGNLSLLSNQVSVWIGPLAERAGLALVAGTQPARAPVDLYWQSEPEAGAADKEMKIFDVGGRLVRAFRLGSATEGVVHWDGRDLEGNALGAGLFFARLDSGRERVLTRIVLLH